MKPFSHILAATDFSGASKQALEVAAMLAHRAGAAATLIHAQDPTPLGPALAHLRLSQVAAEARKRAEQELRAQLGKIRDADFGGVESVQLALVKDDSPALAICDYAREQAIDLIVVGTHGGAAPSRWLIGSVAEKVVRRSPCSVLTVRPTLAGPARLPSRMLVGTDFSPSAEPALDMAARMARLLGAHTTVAYCYDSSIPMAPAVGGPEPLDTRGLAEEAMGDLRAALEELAASKLGGADVDSVVLESDKAADSLTRHAEEGDYDLIVVGAQGRTGRGRVLMGGVAEKVLRHARCSVLTVRPREETDEL